MRSLLMWLRFRGSEVQRFKVQRFRVQRFKVQRCRQPNKRPIKYRKKP
jgi:hypothetical protein